MTPQAERAEGASTPHRESPFGYRNLQGAGLTQAWERPVAAVLDHLELRGCDGDVIAGRS